LKNIINKNMKILSIGDIHGSLEWKNILDLNLDQDLTIFIGDYVDDWSYSNDQIYNNLIDLIQYKKDNLDKVILLLGNHDLQYYFDYNNYGCSGFRPEAYFDLHELFNKNKELFQVAYQYDNYLWTHAGISTGWAEIFKKEIIAHNLNEEFYTCSVNSYLYDVGKSRGGWSKYGGIFWADKCETSTNYIKGLHQIVGHSKVNIIEKLGDENGSIRYIDVLKNKDLNIIDKYYLLSI